MNITPRQLRIFIALAETLNFRRTADLFFITQPSLSKAVKDLEGMFGLVLFERSTRSVRLTVAGERLLTIARRVLGEYDLGVDHMTRLAEHESRRVAIAGIPSLSHALLPVVCKRLEERLHTIEFSIIDDTNAATIHRVLDHQVDFSLASAAPQHPELNYEELLRDRFVLLAPEKWDSQLPDDVTMETLKDLPLICGIDASTAKEYVNAAFLQHGWLFRPKLSFQQVATAAGFVQNGLGILIQPFLGVMPLLDMKGMCLRGINDGPIRSVGIVRRRNAQLSHWAEQAIIEVKVHAQILIQRYQDWILKP